MKYCTRCIMPDTRPGIYFDEEGVCQACHADERKVDVDWDARLNELKALCDQHRGSRGNGHDCIIAVSGGKDSHFQTYVMKELMGMNPLLVSVEDNFPMTDAGMSNIKNISERFGCEIFSLKPNIRAQKRIMRKTFEKYGKPTWYVDRLIYTYPLYMAIKLDIPLVVYGENISFEYGGMQRVETYSAKDQINNDVASEIEYEELIDDVVSRKDLHLCDAPVQEDLNKIEPIYLSYFVRWNSYANYLFAKRNGFKDLYHEWDREHMVDCFDQVDSRAYMVHPWMKYPKFGHATATDIAARLVRYGLMSRDEAIQAIKERDHKLDELAVQDFIDFLGYSRAEFWDIVDNFYNKDIFEKDMFGRWVLKQPIWAEQ